MYVWIKDMQKIGSAALFFVQKFKMTARAEEKNMKIIWKGT